jgi:putative transposase
LGLPGLPSPNAAPCASRAPHLLTTTVAANSRRLFQVEANATPPLELLAHYRNQSRLQLHAFVIMPDHVHAILTPAPDISLERAMQIIKGGFSFRLKSKFDVWSRSFNQTQILSLEKFEACKVISNKTRSE